MPVRKPSSLTETLFQAFPAPHIGHLHTLLMGDILARYNRLTYPWKPVHFLTGTDEHGLKIQQAAAAAGKEPREFCEELSKQFQVGLPIRLSLAKSVFRAF
jgi:methionyl-tRNA synthetase